MFTVKIPKGSAESAPVVLAHKQASCIYLPATEKPVTFLIVGSHDGAAYGPIYHVRKDAEPLSVTTKEHMSIRTFDPKEFEGVMYFKLILVAAADQDFELPIYLKEF